MDSYDFIVIGAGPAGVAAGALLNGTAKTFAVLEARDRIGGRAYSVPLSDGAVVEAGAGYIHGSRLPTWEYVIATGVRTHGDRLPIQYPRMIFKDGAWDQERDDSELAAAREHIQAEWTEPSYATVGVLDALKSDKFTQRQAAAVKAAIATFTSSAHVEGTSAAAAAIMLDMLHMSKAANYTISGGYSELWRRVTARFADRIHLESPVRAVDWSPEGVVLRTDGREYRATAAIVTLPVGVLSAGAVEFRPTLPEAKLEALDGLRMKVAGKMSAEFRHAFWQEPLGDAVRFTNSESMFEWCVPLRQPPVLTWHGGSEPAVWDEFRRSPGSLEAAVLADLAAMFPSVDVRAELVAVHVSDWGADPWATGTTSIALQGKEHLRGQLAAPTPPLYWAGEATRTDGSARTVHGALLSGRTAVVEAMHQMRPFRLDDPSSRLDWSEFPD